MVNTRYQLLVGAKRHTDSTMIENNIHSFITKKKKRNGSDRVSGLFTSIGAIKFQLRVFLKKTAKVNLYVY